MAFKYCPECGYKFDKEYKLTDTKNAFINGLYEKEIKRYRVFFVGKSIDINVT